MLVEDARMEQQADHADVAATLAGDAEAYRRIVQRHQQAIARRMRRFTGDAGTVEELVQDVFVEAYFSLSKFSAKAPFEHWLNRIATFVGYGHLKKQQKQKKRQNMEIVLENQPAAALSNAGETTESIHQVLD